MVISDYHIHSSFSKDSIEKIEEIIQQSKSLRLSEIAITDHLDFDVKSKEKNCSLDDLNNYYETLIKLKEKYKEEINLKIGIEFGIQKHLSKKLEEITKKYSFDFIILSVHTVDKILLNEKEFWQAKTVEEAYRIYFNELLECVKKCNDFSVVGHLDFITRYSSQKKEIDYKQYESTICEIFKILIEKEKGIEINTSGIRYSEDRFYPGTELIKKYFKMGGRIFTVGSDAHKKQEICHNFNEVDKILNDIGIDYTCSFEKMKVNFIKIK